MRAGRKKIHGEQRNDGQRVDKRQQNGNAERKAQRLEKLADDALQEREREENDFGGRGRADYGAEEFADASAAAWQEILGFIRGRTG